MGRNSFERSLRENERDSNSRKTEVLRRAMKAGEPQLGSFTAFHEPEAVKRAQKYVDATEARIASSSEKSETAYHADALEAMFQFEIGLGTMLSDPANETYSTDAIQVTRYDDLRNRIDVAATVHATPESNDDGVSANITFGIDLTTDPTPARIREKILVATNNRDADLPAGFSRLDFYRNSNTNPPEEGTLTCVPRYCIGINTENVDETLSDSTITEGRFSFSRRLADVNNFKILYEMSKQNELYETPLYQKEDAGTITEQEKEALAQLQILDNIYLKELDRITKKMPAWAAERGKDPKTGKISPDKIAQYLMTGEDVADPVFAQIVDTCDQLLAEYDGSGDDTEDSEPDPDYLKKRGREHFKPRTDFRSGPAGNAAMRISTKVNRSTKPSGGKNR